MTDLVHSTTYTWDVEAERVIAGNADCRYWEIFPTEWLGQGSMGGYMWGGAMCHLAPEQQKKSFPGCKGKICNCPLMIETWVKGAVIESLQEDVQSLYDPLYWLVNLLHGNSKGGPDFSPPSDSEWIEAIEAAKDVLDKNRPYNYTMVSMPRQHGKSTVFQHFTSRLQNIEFKDKDKTE